MPLTLEERDVQSSPEFLAANLPVTWKLSADRLSRLGKNLKYLFANIPDGKVFGSIIDSNSAKQGNHAPEIILTDLPTTLGMSEELYQQARTEIIFMIQKDSQALEGKIAAEGGLAATCEGQRWKVDQLTGEHLGAQQQEEFLRAAVKRALADVLEKMRSHI